MIATLTVQAYTVNYTCTRIPDCLAYLHVVCMFSRQVSFHQYVLYQKKKLSFSAYARLIHVTLGVEKSTLETFIASIAILQVQQDESKWQGFWYGAGLPF